MAESPSHRFGQVVGGLLEEMLLPELLQFCDERGLYLDRHGGRVAVRKGRKVTWEDRFGNFHDLDFVIEKDGSAERRGRPVAFIEAAWRRYTKHSRAKAQEIQGAVLPIAERFEVEAPFLGAVLAGVFTGPSLDQLRSLGFHIAYLPYETILRAFATVGVNAQFDETTPDREFRRCVGQIEDLSPQEREAVRRAMYDANRDSFDGFFAKLRRKLDRTIERVAVLPLFGVVSAFATASEAAAFIRSFDKRGGSGEFQKFEISMSFSNGDEVRGTFRDEAESLRFLAYVAA